MKLKDYQASTNGGKTTTRSTGFPAPTEHDIQGLIINYLQSKRYYVQRLNAGKYSMGEGRSKRFVQGVKTGTPDVMAFRGIKGNQAVKLLFLEIKRPGNEPTVAQVLKMNELEEHGAQCFVIHSLEELQELGI